MLRRNRREQILRVPPSVEGRGVLSISLNDIGHRCSGYSGRQLDGTASNKALKLTKHRDGAVARCFAA